MGKEENANKTLTILLLRAPYGTEAADMAVNTAFTAKKMGYNVNMFLYGDGTWLAHLKTEKPYDNAGEWLRWALKKGVNVAMCIRCSEARDLVEEDIVPGVKRAGLYELVNMVKASDKVLTFTEGA